MIPWISTTIWTFGLNHTSPAPADPGELPTCSKRLTSKVKRAQSWVFGKYHRQNDEIFKWSLESFLSSLNAQTNFLSRLYEREVHSISLEKLVISASKIPFLKRQYGAHLGPVGFYDWWPELTTILVINWLDDSTMSWDVNSQRETTSLRASMELTVERSFRVGSQNRVQ